MPDTRSGLTRRPDGCPAYESTGDTTRLKQIGQGLADAWGEKVLVILDPPPSPIHGSRSVIPYCVLSSQADAAERAAAAECLGPGGVTP